MQKKSENNILVGKDSMDRKFYTEEEALNQVIGEKGSVERAEFDAQVETFLIGEAIRQARQSKNLTQAQLGELVGVKKSQICKIENGANVTFNTVARVFRAMGIRALLDLGSLGRVAIC